MSSAMVYQASTELRPPQALKQSLGPKTEINPPTATHLLRPKYDTPQKNTQRTLTQGVASPSVLGIIAIQHQATTPAKHQSDQAWKEYEHTPSNQGHWQNLQCPPIPAIQTTSSGTLRRTTSASISPINSGKDTTGSKGSHPSTSRTNSSRLAFLCPERHK